LRSAVGNPADHSEAAAIAFHDDVFTKANRFDIFWRELVTFPDMGNVPVGLPKKASHYRP